MTCTDVIFGTRTVEEVMSTLDALVRTGKIRAIGLSNVPAWYAAKAQMIARSCHWEPVAALQLEYSLAERAIEREHVPPLLTSESASSRGHHWRTAFWPGNTPKEGRGRFRAMDA